MARELFIYYRIRAGDAVAALAAAESMQAQLRAGHPGLEARLLRRPESEAGRETWMECYRGVEGSAALVAAIERAAAGWSGLVDGTRHVEVFEAFDGPAGRPD